MKETSSPPLAPLKPTFKGTLPDERLAKRGSELLSAILVGCSAIIAQIAKDRCTQIAYYRFLNNKRVEASDLVTCLAEFVGERAKYRHVLVIQDTTEVNYRHHQNWIDLDTFGPVGNNVDPGFFLHSSLVIDAGRRCILGFADIHAWKRDFKQKGCLARKYPTLPIEEKESYKWIESALRTKQALDESTTMTIICDREADIYEFFARVPDERTDLIVRCRQDRRLIGDAPKLYKWIDELPPAGQYRFWVRGEKRLKNGGRTAHEALMEVRYGEVRMRRSKKLTVEAPPYLDMYLVEVKEHPSTVPQGEDPIHWRLLTTHPVEDLKMARQIVEWYRQRWHIEQVFRVLKKQGLRLENSRLKNGDALIKLAVMSLQVSIKILQASMAKNADPKILANVAFSKMQIDALWLIKEEYEGNTEKLKNPYSPESLAWAAWTIARLGGWKGYLSQGKPGPIRMKRGLEKFENMIKMIEIFGKP